MNLFDDEIEIVRHFQSVPTNSIYIIPKQTQDAIDVLLSILDEKCWLKWTDSSGKGDPPPDFYCNELQLMMDVMRVDDHGFISERGKTVNPTRAKENEIIKELRNKNVFVANPNIKLQVLASTDLPTEEDHNYIFYRDSFKRTIESHIRKIVRYKENHPNFKTIFFVFDESSLYFEIDSKERQLQVGEAFEGIPHLWFEDEEFVKTFSDSEIDYLIWYTPYKHCTAYAVEDVSHLNLPQAVIYDLKHIDIPLTVYNSALMESAEF